MPTLDEFNEVGESLFKSGTRYQAEKWIVVGLYAVVVVSSALWAIIGTDLRGELVGEFESRQFADIQHRTFELSNTGRDEWRDVRVAVNGRYLVHFESIAPESSVRLKPEDFTYFYHVPRPWGHARWETVNAEPKPGPAAPSTLAVDDLKVRAERGPIDITRPGSE